MGGVAREAYDRLTGRVPASNDGHAASSAGHRLTRARAVVDTRAQEFIDSRNLETTPLDPACQEHGP